MLAQLMTPEEIRAYVPPTPAQILEMRQLVARKFGLPESAIGIEVKTHAVLPESIREIMREARAMPPVNLGLEEIAHKTPLALEAEHEPPSQSGPQDQTFECDWQMPPQNG